MKYRVGDKELPFPIGTKVICSYDGGEPFTGIFHGQSETRGDCWAIERSNGVKGVAQNDWWNWYKEFTMGEIGETITYVGEHKPFNHLINNKFMSIKNKIKMLMTGEPEKTLIKHGILTIEKELTTEGKQLFNEFIENKFKEEFLNGLYEVLKDEKLED